MELIRTKAKFVSLFMAFLMFLIAVPCQSIFAAMVATDITFESARADKSREDLKQSVTTPVGRGMRKAP